MGTRVLDSDGQLTLNMTNVELPLPGSIQPSEKVTSMFVEKLLVDHNVYAAHFYHNGRWWTRCSAQVWNEVCFRVCFVGVLGLRRPRSRTLRRLVKPSLPCVGKWRMLLKVTRKGLWVSAVNSKLGRRFLDYWISVGDNN